MKKSLKSCYKSKCLRKPKCFGNSRSMSLDNCIQSTNPFEILELKSFFPVLMVYQSWDKYRPQQFRVYHTQVFQHHPLRSMPRCHSIQCLVVCSMKTWTLTLNCLWKTKLKKVNSLQKQHPVFCENCWAIVTTNFVQQYNFAVRCTKFASLTYTIAHQRSLIWPKTFFLARKMYSMNVQQPFPSHTSKRDATLHMCCYKAHIQSWTVTPSNDICKNSSEAEILLTMPTVTDKLHHCFSWADTSKKFLQR